VTEADVEPNTGLGERGFGFLWRLPWKRLAFWAGFLCVLYLLRDFFDILFFAFLFTYIFGSACQFLVRHFDCERSLGRRQAIVIGFYALVTSLVTVSISIAYPHLLEQGKVMIKRVGDVSIWADADESPGAAPAAATSPRPTATGTRPLFVASETASQLGKWPKERVEKLLWRFLGQEGFDRFRESSIYRATLGITQNLLNVVMPPLTQQLGRVFEDFLRYMVHLFLALLLSLIVILELPRLSALFRGLEQSRIGSFYREVTPSLVSFGTILGKAFGAQALVAVVNTALTAVGLLLLGIPHAFVLSGIVFVCSFIPVLGVVFSTVPIALSAVKAGGGMMVLWGVLWIAAVYSLKAYLLYPRLVGSFMRVHPLLVVVILIAAEELFGFWGLVLGVPVCYYLYHHWVRGDEAELARTPIGPLRKPAAQ
jgi:predicted PurR-regulated permease PerM